MVGPVLGKVNMTDKNATTKIQLQKHCIKSEIRNVICPGS